MPLNLSLAVTPVTMEEAIWNRWQVLKSKT